MRQESGRTHGHGAGVEQARGCFSEVVDDADAGGNVAADAAEALGECA